MVLGRNPQKIRDREFERKKERLMQYLSSAPSFVIHRSFAILQKMYNSPSSLEHFELKIKPHLESLLNDEIQAETYVEIVKFRKRFESNRRWSKNKRKGWKEKKEKEDQEKLRKQRDEELQRQREEERKKEKKFLEIQQLEEQERLRKQKEETEKLKKSKERLRKKQTKEKGTGRT